jgi:hypothetical protein
MARALTARYGSADAARNAHEDLIGSGYPSEKVYLDRDAAEVRVLVPTSTEREAREILGRHQPEEITARDA